MPDDKKADKASSATLAHIEELLDEALKQTFPASDPVAITIEHASDVDGKERQVGISSWHSGRFPTLPG
jgi:hypothetical protein